MRNAENIRSLWQVEPTHIGMIFHQDSKRFVLEELEGFPFESSMDDPINTGVFVDASLETIKKRVKAFKLRAVQLHGDESPELCKVLKKEGLQVIKVFLIDYNFDFNQCTPYQEVCDYFLFDYKGKQQGGNGKAFDWSLLKNYKGTRPYVLAGGLNSEMFEDLSDFLKKPEAKNCAGIDLNSGFEILPGLKDIEELKLFKEKFDGR